MDEEVRSGASVASDRRVELTRERMDQAIEYAERTG